MECKVSQSIDTSIILDVKKHLTAAIFAVLDAFATISGLSVNYKKTEDSLILSSRFQSNKSHKMATNQNVNWAAHKFKIMGI